MKWKNIELADIPTRKDFELLTLNLLRDGICNSDRMREQICNDRRLKLDRPKGGWKTASGKFINEHAWVLANLVANRIIKKVGPKEYSLVGSQSFMHSHSHC